MKDFLEKIVALKSSSKKRILRELEHRMDDRGNLFLRFDKQRAYMGDLKIVEHGDALHLKLKIAAYPARKEEALKVARQIFQE